MFPVKFPLEQVDPPLSPRETLPTMYDLPSEDPEEPGLPDEFHDLQPQLLSLTFRPPNYPADLVFTVGDMNLYYDVRHPNWYKRPDWFGVVGVPRLYDEQNLRLSYVVWQEGVNPFVVVELISPGTEKEDLGETRSQENQPPTKWEVYEQILRVPYYVVFDRYTDRLRVYSLLGCSYQMLDLPESRFWIPGLELGLGLWHGEYQGISRLWLRWYDDRGNWIPTEAEQERLAKQSAQQLLESAQQLLEQERLEKESAQQLLEQERQLLEQERQKSAKLAEQLRALGIDPETLS